MFWKSNKMFSIFFQIHHKYISIFCNQFNQIMYNVWKFVACRIQCIFNFINGGKTQHSFTFIGQNFFPAKVTVTKLLFIPTSKNVWICNWSDKGLIQYAIQNAKSFINRKYNRFKLSFSNILTITALRFYFVIR